MDSDIPSATRPEFPWYDIPDVTESQVPTSTGYVNLAELPPDIPANRRASRDISDPDSRGQVPILFLHGVLRHWRTFYPLIERLRSDVPLAGLDFRGHGRSSAVARGVAYRVVDYLSDLPTVLSKFATTGVVIHGHSLGAMVAFAAAAECSEIVRGVVLEDPPFDTMGRRLERLPLLRFFLGVQSLLERVSPRTADNLFQPFSNLIVGEREDGSPVRIRDQRDELSRWFSAESFSLLDPAVLSTIASGRWLEGFEWQTICRRVRCPVVLLRSDTACGGMLTAEDALHVAEALGAKAELHEFPGCGHNLHGSCPDRLVELLRGLRRRVN